MLFVVSTHEKARILSDAFRRCGLPLVDVMSMDDRNMEKIRGREYTHLYLNESHLLDDGLQLTDDQRGLILSRVRPIGGAR